MHNKETLLRTPYCFFYRQRASEAWLAVRKAVKKSMDQEERMEVDVVGYWLEKSSPLFNSIPTSRRKRRQTSRRE